MKTSEFINCVEELGYTVFIGSYDMYIKKNGVEIYYVSEYLLYSMDTDTNNNLDESDESTKKELFELMVEYTSTPIEDRKEEKKYYIRPKDMNVGDDVWNYYELIGKWDINDVVKDSYRMTEFTRKEIKELTGQELEHYSYCEVGTDTWVN